MPLTSIDLFAGAGGLTAGFKQEGFECLYANEIDKDALKTFNRNHGAAASSADPVEEIDAAAVRRELGLEPGELDLVMGGPPCQGFSTYGKREESDPRNQLYIHFLRFVDEFRPKAVVIENVVGLLSMDGGDVATDIEERLEKLGYGTNVVTLDAADYGVPQRRKRVFFLALSDRGRIEEPVPSHSADDTGSSHSSAQTALDFGSRVASGLPPALTVKDAIGDLPVIALPPKKTHETMEYGEASRTAYQRAMRGRETRLTHHSAKQMLGIRRLRLALMRPGEYGANIRERIRTDGLPEDVINELLSGSASLRSLDQCRKQDREREAELHQALAHGGAEGAAVLELLDSGGFANKYRRLDWGSPSHTLVAHMARDCSDFVHPEADRFVTVREAARLQSFPDSYYFCGSQFRQFKQIGNAVPPLLATALARSVKTAIGKDFALAA